MALLGSAIAAVAVLWWLRFPPEATRRRGATGAAVVRQDDLLHRGGRVADDRAGANLAPRPAAAMQSAAIAAPPAPTQPDPASRRSGTATETAVQTDLRARDPRSLSAETDRGRLTRTWHEARRVYVDVPFRTFFKRPLLYRFEWLGGSDPYRERYWANPTGFLVSRPSGASSRHASFAGVFPYSESAVSYYVLQLLAPQAARPDTRFLLSAVRLDDETIDGVTCFQLSGAATRQLVERHLWIGRFPAPPDSHHGAARL